MGCVSGGNACAGACTAGYVCSNGACSYQCNATTCPTGCCSANICYAGTASSACGTSGAACVACSGYQTCGGGGTAHACGCTASTSCASAGELCRNLGRGCGDTPNCGSCSWARATCSRRSWSPSDGASLCEPWFCTPWPSGQLSRCRE